MQFMFSKESVASDNFLKPMKTKENWKMLQKMQQILSVFRIVQEGIEIVSGLQVNCYACKFILIHENR